MRCSRETPTRCGGRLLDALGLPSNAGYEALRRALLAALPHDAAHLAEWHALIVRGRIES